jgi:AraC-like DNA-binding protein
MDQRVQRVITLIENDFARHLSETVLAAEVNLSTWRLCHLFKGETGMAPWQYLRAVRMDMAKNLLETTFLSIKEIRVKIGLHDQSHFIRAFERAYNISPTHYRVRYWKTRQEQDRQLNSKIGH